MEEGKDGCVQSSVNEDGKTVALGKVHVHALSEVPVPAVPVPACQPGARTIANVSPRLAPPSGLDSP